MSLVSWQTVSGLERKTLTASEGSAIRFNHLIQTSDAEEVKCGNNALPRLIVVGKSE